MNWNCKIEKVENILQSWSKRELSLFGRIQIIKTFALSQFVLPASLLAVPLNIIKHIETMLYKFLWGGKDKVKRKKVIQDLKQGGLNMVDIRSIFRSFKAVWISRIFQSNPCVHGWVQLAHHYLKPFLNCSEDLIFNVDDTVDFCEIQKLNSFYKEVFASYNEVFVQTEESFLRGIHDECLWGNKFFVHRINGKKKVLFLRNWVRSGVNKVSDLQFIGGELDMNFMYDRIMYRSNILMEILIVREALLPYKEYFRNIDRLPNMPVVNCKPKTAKEFYVVFRNISTKDVPVVTNYLKRYTEVDCELVFHKTLYLKKKSNLKNLTLKCFMAFCHAKRTSNNGKLKTDDECDVCMEQQTIKHLLWDCCYVKSLWKIVEEVCGIEISFGKVLGTEDCNDYDHVLTLISFLIYKKWLLLSLEGKTRQRNISLEFYKHEIELRRKIYELCAKYDIWDIQYMNILLDHINEANITV